MKKSCSIQEDFLDNNYFTNEVWNLLLSEYTIQSSVLQDFLNLLSAAIICRFITEYMFAKPFPHSMKPEAAFYNIYTRNLCFIPEPGDTH